MPEYIKNTTYRHILRESWDPAKVQLVLRSPRSTAYFQHFEYIIILCVLLYDIIRSISQCRSWIKSRSQYMVDRTSR